MKLRVKKKQRSRWIRSFRRRLVRVRGDHRRWWVEGILCWKKDALLEGTPQEEQ